MKTLAQMTQKLTELEKRDLQIFLLSKRVSLRTIHSLWYSAKFNWRDRDINLIAAYFGVSETQIAKRDKVFTQNQSYKLE